MIANWPGVIPEGSVNDDLICFTYFFPTLADVAGLDVPEGALDGQSFAPVLYGEEADLREWLYMWWYRNNDPEEPGDEFARMHRYKCYQDGRFYDLREDPLAFAQQNTARIAELLDVADLALLSFGEARADLKAALEADDPWKRYWALIACSVFGEEAAGFEAQARALASDEEVPVRIRAAELLGVLGAEDPMPILYDAVGAATNEADALLALNTMTYLQDHLGYEVDPERIDPDVKSDQIDWRLGHIEKTYETN